MSEPLGRYISTKHGYAFDGAFITEKDNGVVLLTPGNFAIGGGYQEGKKFFSGPYPDEYVLSPGDLVVTMTDLSKAIDTLGYAALIPDDGRIYLHNQRIGLLKLRSNEVSKTYLSYLLRTHNYQRTIAGGSTGSTVHHTSPAKIEAYPVDLPPLSIQQRIAEVLSAYDKLIENNRRQIKLLEEAAQRLYKEWFVDLRFPGHETTPIHNGLPEGWSKVTVGDICELVKKVSRHGDRSRDTTYIGLEHMPRHSICLDMYGDVSLVAGNKLRFMRGDILFGKIRPYFHKVGFAQCDGVASTDTLIMRAKPGFFGLLLEAVSSDDYVAYATATSKTGTKMPRANWDAMRVYDLRVPSRDLLTCFDGFVWDITAEITSLSRQIAAAREARDRLLPKLMSGEIEV